MTTFTDDTPFIKKGFMISTDKNLLDIDVYT
jgi:hypothetical protein